MSGGKSVGEEIVDHINEWLEQNEKEHTESGESHVNTDHIEALCPAIVQVRAAGTSQVPRE